MKRFFLLLILIVGLFLSACQSQPVTGEEVAVTGGSYRNLTPQELNGMLKDKDFVLINVHIPFAGSIAGTDRSVAYHEIEQNLSQLPAQQDAKIVLYCRSGRMSQIAAEQLVALGYTNIWNLKGGMIEWEQQGFDLAK